MAFFLYLEDPFLATTWYLFLHIIIQITKLWNRILLSLPLSTGLVDGVGVSAGDVMERGSVTVTVREIFRINIYFLIVRKAYIS